MSESLGETLREWCIGLGVLAEENGATRIVVETETTVYEYRRDVGLRVEVKASEGRRPLTYELPEDALAEERFEVIQ